MLLGWQDVVESIFDIAGRDGDALVLFNFLDELTYRTRSNLGRRAFRPLKKGMILVGRLVRAGDDWMVSGNPAAFPASVLSKVEAFYRHLAQQARPAPNHQKSPLWTSPTTYSPPTASRSTSLRAKD